MTRLGEAYFPQVSGPPACPGTNTKFFRIPFQLGLSMKRFSMADLERLWTTIPVSEDRAEGATALWKRYDLGARVTMHHTLNRLTAEGRIKRISRPMPNGGEFHLYYSAVE